jgi:AraC-like DNA-binding protein
LSEKESLFLPNTLQFVQRQEELSQPRQEFTDRPANVDGSLGLALHGRPNDLLSELLGSVRLRGEQMIAYAPAGTFSIGFAGVGALHIIEQGELQLRLDTHDHHPERVRRGDVILLPRGDAHHLGNLQPEPGSAPDADEPRWLCGTFKIGDPQASHLLTSLPAVITLHGLRDLEWLEVCRRMLLLEMQAPTQGSVVMVARILDLLFIHILRAWAARSDTGPNWMVGALDPQIGPALGAIHAHPGHHWTVEDLGHLCCLSRSAFAELFAARVGKPPASYLAHVRLDAAATLLRDSSTPVEQIAKEVGYSSPTAFTRAFSHRYGTPPARWRRGHTMPKENPAKT